MVAIKQSSAAVVVVEVSLVSDVSAALKVTATEGLLAEYPDASVVALTLIGVVPVQVALTASKLMAAGMTELDAFDRVTAAPATLLGLAGEVGRLAGGACADLTLLMPEHAARLVDVEGETRSGTLWRPGLTIRGGRVVPGSGPLSDSSG